MIKKGGLLSFSSLRGKKANAPKPQKHAAK
jgi:hypothetical protein